MNVSSHHSGRMGRVETYKMGTQRATAKPKKVRPRVAATWKSEDPIEMAPLAEVPVVEAAADEPDDDAAGLEDLDNPEAEAEDDGVTETTTEAVVTLELMGDTVTTDETGVLEATVLLPVPLTGAGLAWEGSVRAPMPQGIA